MKYLLIIFALSALQLSAQSIQWSELAPMPERVTNNALTTATVGGVPYVYSFAGMDSTKSCNGDHLRSFRYNTQTNEWETIAPLPDAMGGKIAAGASTINNKIYIIGGYHITSNCSEISSKKIHVYDPETNSYLADGADLPKAIDDHIQAVWRDSLIYVITGWSNSSNVRNVQVYNPTEDEWAEANFIPNMAEWRVFGGSGTIIGDTIYFAGGAGNWNGSTFPATSFFRKGYINPDNPFQIEWSGFDDPLARGYRMGASDFQGQAIWFGGSQETYNFDGIAYNGSGPVPPTDNIIFYNPATGHLNNLSGFIPPLMDLRGVAKIDENQFITAGGMIESQEVTNKAFQFTIDALTRTNSSALEEKISLFPNPAKDWLMIKGEGQFVLEWFAGDGRFIKRQMLAGNERISLQTMKSGVYFVKILQEGKFRGVEKIILIE